MSNIGLKYSVFILDEYTLKQNSPLSINVSSEKLNSAILNAQVRFIEPSLGNDLFVDILNQINNAGGDINLLSNDYQVLIKDYINPALIQWTLYLASLDTTFQWFNGGIGNYGNENFKTSTLDEIRYLRNEIKNMAEYLDRRLYIYLCDHSNLYPLWLNCNDPVARKQDYLGGFTFTGNKPTLIDGMYRNKSWRNGWI
jgi:hypothetical protein